MTSQNKYLTVWEQAMRCGLLSGRPYSEECIRSYTYYVKWFLGNYDAISITNFKQAMMDIPIESFARRLKLYEALNCFVRYLNNESLMDDTYIKEVKRYKPKRHLPIQKTVVDEKGIDALLSVCKAPFERMVIILLSQTGLRATEAAKLTLSDIDIERRILTVKLAKWGKTRRIGLTEHLVKHIRDYLETRPTHESDYFLIDLDGDPVHRRSLLDCCRRLSKRCGVKVSPHALRRAFVTINANKGRPLVMLQMACGHSDIATTRSYCLTTEDEAIEAMQCW